MKITKRRTITALGLLGLIYLAVCFYFWAFQIEKVLAPTGVIPTDPLRMGMKFEDATIPVGEGSQQAELDGFWVPAEDPAPDTPTFLYLHGQDATIGKNLEHTQRLHQLGYNVLVIDYRGFGASYGDFQPTEATVYEDAEAAWAYLIQECDCQPDHLFIYGHSLGGAVAIELATHHSDAAGLVAESTFTSILDMSKERYGGVLRLLPINLLLNQRFDSLSKIGSLKIPVLLIHGDHDEKVPCRMSQQLYAAAPKPKQLLMIAGGGHANSGSIGLVKYRETLRAFVERWL